MPRIIFKCPYLKPGQHHSAAHREHYVRYIATREGVDRLDPGRAALPATEKQQKMVEQLLRDFPSSRELFEYEDYLNAPTRENTSEFITRAIEDGADSLAKRENYVDYIAKRPKAERFGAHGLFTGADDPLVLSQVADTVAAHPGNVWLPIISLRREDAARLGYDNAGQWKDLLTSYAPQLADAMKIPFDQFRWYAAFHNEGHHPHIHMVCCSADSKTGFLTKEGIANIKSGLAKEIFRQELTAVYQRQTQRRDDLIHEAGETLTALIRQMREEVLRTYRDDMPKRVPLSRQQEFKRIKNLVIEEAVRLEHEAASFSPSDDSETEGPLPDPPPPENEPPEAGSDEPAFEMPPRIVWSTRYKEARSLLHGNRNTPPDSDKTYQLMLEEAQSGNALAMFDLDRMFAGGIGKVIDPGQAQAWYAKALAAFQSVEQTRPNRYAEYRIGKIFASGTGTAQNYEAAAEWLTKSAANGCTYAQYSLARLYSEGRGVERNGAAALQLYEEAAAKGFPYAAWELGKLYQRGIGVGQDMRQSNWYFTAALRGFKVLERQSHDSSLQYRIGWMCLRGVGTKQNEAAAREWFKKSARLGNANTQYQLAKLMLGDTTSTAEEISQAVNWLTKAAEAGLPYAQYALGKLYRDGGPVAQSDIQAVIWFSEAAEQGHEYAMFGLGKLHLKNRSIPSACRWFHKAAELGNSLAQYQLGKLLLSSGGVPKDVKYALHWLTASAKQGNQFAQYALGKLYLLGKEVPQNQEAALHWFTLAA